MYFNFQPTFYGYPIFVVWKTIRKERKKRVVIDIRGFNKITVMNFYFMPLQSNIIFVINGRQFDADGFLRQWFVRLTDRHQFTVVLHRNQENLIW